MKRPYFYGSLEALHAGQRVVEALDTPERDYEIHVHIGDIGSIVTNSNMDEIDPRSREDNPLGLMFFDMDANNNSILVSTDFNKNNILGDALMGATLSSLEDAHVEFSEQALDDALDQYMELPGGIMYSFGLDFICIEPRIFQAEMVGQNLSEIAAQLRDEDIYSELIKCALSETEFAEYVRKQIAQLDIVYKGKPSLSFDKKNTLKHDIPIPSVCIHNKKKYKAFKAKQYQWEKIGLYAFIECGTALVAKRKYPDITQDERHPIKFRNKVAEFLGNDSTEEKIEQLKKGVDLYFKNQDPLR